MKAAVRNRGRTISLGDIAELRNGVNFTASQRGTGVPVLNVKDFQNRSRPNYSGLEELKRDAVRDDALLQTGDILFVRSNGNKELIGRSMFVDVTPPRPTTHSAFTIRARIFSPEADPRFCAYSMRGGTVRTTLSARGSGTNISNLNQDILARLQIWLPSLDVQRRIASILTAYDDLIEVNTRRIAILEEMSRRLLSEWCSLPGSLDAELGDLCILQKKKFVAEYDSGLPLLDLARIPSKCLAPDETGSASELTTARIVFQSGDTLFGAIRPYLHKVVIVPFAGVTNLSVLVLRPKRRAFRAMLAIIASNDETIRWADQHSGGTKMPVIKWEVLRSMPVKIPAERITNRFEDVAGTIIDQILCLALANRKLLAARDLLLPKLISGEIDVSGAELEVDRVAKQVAAE